MMIRILVMNHEDQVNMVHHHTIKSIDTTLIPSNQYGTPSSQYGTPPSQYDTTPYHQVNMVHHHTIKSIW